MTPRAKRHKPTSAKSKEALFALWLFFGWCGGHRFYLGNTALGTVYAAANVVTCCLSGLLGYADGFLLVLGTAKDAHGLPVVWSWQRGRLMVDPLEEGTYEPSESVARIFFHVGLVFLLPFVVATAGMSLFETSEVKDTLPTFAVLGGLLLVPLFLVQLWGTVRKSRAQIALLRREGALTTRTRLDAIARSAAIVTPRGLLVLVTGAAFLTLSLAYQWASLGLIAVLSLSAFYLVSASAALLSSFVVRRFSSNLLERGGSVHRSFSPGVARVGDPVYDVVEVKGVPVPPGFFLTMQGLLPARLGTEVRHVILPKPRHERLSLSAIVKRTPRGTYDAPALRIAFTDLLGLTSAQVASLATARLRVLPSARAAEVVPPPPSNEEEPDILSRPHRFPTEDLFRFREYVAGDDTRRIHWRMSMRSGRMVVKKPDSRETTSKRVVLALDTWVPKDWLDHTVVIDDALDSLVEAWLSMAQRLVEQGEKVTLLVVARSDDGQRRPEVIPCSGSNHAHWLDAGARAEWQADIRIEDVLDYGLHNDPRTADEAGFDNAVVVTMLLAPPALPRVARETTWVHYDPEAALGPRPRSSFALWVDYDDTGRKASWREMMKRVFFLPHPVGAEENGLLARVRHLERRLEDRVHRLALRHLATMTGQRAVGALLTLPDAVYRLDVVDGGLRMVGLKGSTRAPRAVDPHQAQRVSAWTPGARLQ